MTGSALRGGRGGVSAVLMRPAISIRTPIAPTTDYVPLFQFVVHRACTCGLRWKAALQDRRCSGLRHPVNGKLVGPALGSLAAAAITR
jgi:hypothetical protein